MKTIQIEAGQVWLDQNKIPRLIEKTWALDTDQAEVLLAVEGSPLSQKYWVTVEDLTSRHTLREAQS